jgi:hypothetical protein
VKLVQSDETEAATTRIVHRRKTYFTSSIVVRVPLQGTEQKLLSG